MCYCLPEWSQITAKGDLRLRISFIIQTNCLSIREEVKERSICDTLENGGRMRNCVGGEWPPKVEAGGNAKEFLHVSRGIYR